MALTATHICPKCDGDCHRINTDADTSSTQVGLWSCSQCGWKEGEDDYVMTPADWEDFLAQPGPEAIL